jgi:hypothetical protein
VAVTAQKDEAKKITIITVIETGVIVLILNGGIFHE